MFITLERSGEGGGVAGGLGGAALGYSMDG